MPSNTLTIDEALIDTIAGLLDDMKAEHITAYDLRPLCSYSDFVMVASANSNTHARALVNQLNVKLKEMNVDILSSIKREEVSNWNIIDIGQAIIHIFMPEAREYYKLEDIYTDGKQIIPKAM